MWNRMKAYLSPPVFEGDEDKTRVAGLVNTVVLTLLVSLSFYAVAFPVLAPGRAYRMILIVPMFLLLLALPLIRRGQVYFAGALLVTGAWLTFTVTALTSGGVRAPVFSGYILIVLGAGLLLSQRAAFVFAGLSLLAGLAMVYAQDHGILPASDLIDLPMTAWMTHAAFLSVAAVLLSLATRSIDGALARVRQELAERRQAEAALKDSQERYRTLFEDSPVSLWEEDFSAAKTYIDRLRDAGIQDLGSYFENHPEAVEQCVDMVRVIDVNKAALEWHHVASKDALLGNMSRLLGPEGRKSFKKELIGLVEGGTHYELAIARQDQAGNPLHLIINGTVAPGYKDSWGRVLVSILDITEHKTLQAKSEQVQAATYRVSEAAQAARNLQELYRSIHAIIGELMAAKNFYIALYDASTDLLSFPYYADEFDSAWPPQKPGRGLTEHVLRTGKPLLATPPVYEQLEKAGEVVSIGTPSVDWLGVPLRTEDEIIGVMAVQTYNEAERLSKADEDVLMFVSTQVAMAIERKRAEDELRKLSRAVEQSPACIVVTDPDGKIEYVNPKFTQLTGYTLQEALGKNPRILKSGYTPDEEYTRLWNTITSGGEWRGQFCNKKKNGDFYWESASISPVIDQLGIITHFVAVKEDITEHKRVEEALRESEHQYRTTLDAMGDAIHVVDRGLSFVLINKRFLDWNRELNLTTDVMGKDIFQVFPFLPENVRDEYSRVFQTGEILVTEESVRWQGQEIFTETRKIPIFREGKVFQVVTVISDITERKRAEEALRESEQLYRSLINVMPEGVALSDISGNITFASPQLLAIYGATSVQDALGTNALQWIAPESHEKALANIQSLVSNGAPSDNEYVLLRKDGTRFLGEIDGALLTDDKGNPKGLVTVHRDITERKQAEEEIHRLNAELEQRVIERTAQLEAANKELESFSYSVSHDLRAPLRAIDGFSRVLQEEYATTLPAEASRLLASVRANTQRMGRLIDDLLKFSRLSRQPLNRRPVEPAELVHQALQTLSLEQAGRQVEIVVGEQLPPCQGDPGLLLQVWVNLLSNALKFTRPREAARIEIGCQVKENGERVYYVQDNGTGFDMRYADKLFGVFQRLHSADEFEGTGVGLALVQRIILRHGGRIWADAQPDVGATFYFTL